jgi:hypothetical protein
LLKLQIIHDQLECVLFNLFNLGQAKDPFDWEMRPFFLEFGADDEAVRAATFATLCQRIGIGSCWLCIYMHSTTDESQMEPPLPLFSCCQAAKALLKDSG